MGDLSLILKHFALEGEQIVRKNPRRSQDRIVRGTPSKRGYLQVSVGKRGSAKTLLLHRVKFALVNGYLPEQVDHEDRQRSNIESANLRPATHTQNRWNHGDRHKPTGLPRGVSRSWSKRRKAYRYSARAANTHLGMFDTPEEASAAYQTFCRQTRGEWHPD